MFAGLFLSVMFIHKHTKVQCRYG